MKSLKNEARLPVSQMSKGKDTFKPLRHKETREPFSDVEYLIALGKAISLEGDEWAKLHPHIEYHKEGIDKTVQDFAQIIYKGYCDGIPKSELAEYVKHSIDLNS